MSPEVSNGMAVGIKWVCIMVAWAAGVRVMWFAVRDGLIKRRIMYGRPDKFATGRVAVVIGVWWVCVGLGMWWAGAVLATHRIGW